MRGQISNLYIVCLDGGGGGGGGVKAVNVDGGGGSRLKGPAGQPGQLNGMPSKKSHSTSKLSGKGEQGKYQSDRESLALVASGPGETVRWLVILYLSLLLTDGEGEDCDWVAPHQNTVSHVDPHAPLAGLPPGEGNAPLPPSFLSARTSHLAPGEWRHHCSVPLISVTAAVEQHAVVVSVSLLSPCVLSVLSCISCTLLATGCYFS